MLSNKPLKKPVSVLVVLHDGGGNALILERADRAGFWQSVTGSLEEHETPFDAALREVAEETGIVLTENQLHDWQHSVEYEIYPHWRHRYPSGITHNTEHWFTAQINAHTPIVLTEHTAMRWLPLHQAAQQVFSPSNQEALRLLSEQT